MTEAAKPMSFVRVVRDTTASADACWAVIADFGNIHRFNPYLTHASLLGQAETPAIGTERQCDLKGGGYLRERIVDWREGGHYTVRVQETSLPMDDVETTLGLVRGSTGTTLFMETRYTPRFGLAGALVDKTILRRVVAARFGRILASLAETATRASAPVAAD